MTEGSAGSSGIIDVVEVQRRDCAKRFVGALEVGGQVADDLAVKHNLQRVPSVNVEA